MLIFFGFTPMDYKQKIPGDIPLLEMTNFEMHELDTEGLQTIMVGDVALRFKDRYVVEKIDFTDATKNLISNMKANHGIYKGNVVDLKGNVVYYREDGIALETETLNYNTVTAIAQTNDKYVAFQDQNTMYGTSMIYDTLIGKMDSKNVLINYKLSEKKK